MVAKVPPDLLKPTVQPGSTEPIVAFFHNFRLYQLGSSAVGSSDLSDEFVVDGSVIALCLLELQLKDGGFEHHCSIMYHYD